jgi:hypothetical protein
MDLLMAKPTNRNQVYGNVLSAKTLVTPMVNIKRNIVGLTTITLPATFVARRVVLPHA